MQVGATTVSAYLCEVFGIVSVTVALHFVQVFVFVPSDVQVGCFVITALPYVWLVHPQVNLYVFATDGLYVG